MISLKISFNIFDDVTIDVDESMLFSEFEDMIRSGIQLKDESNEDILDFNISILINDELMYDTPDISLKELDINKIYVEVDDFDDEDDFFDEDEGKKRKGLPYDSEPYEEQSMSVGAVSRGGGFGGGLLSSAVMFYHMPVASVAVDQFSLRPNDSNDSNKSISTGVTKKRRNRRRRNISPALSSVSLRPC